MRTHLSPGSMCSAQLLQPQHLEGARWLHLTGFAAYDAGLLERALELANKVTHPHRSI